MEGLRRDFSITSSIASWARTWPNAARCVAPVTALTSLVDAVIHATYAVLQLPPWMVSFVHPFPGACTCRYYRDWKSTQIGDHIESVLRCVASIAVCPIELLTRPRAAYYALQNLGLAPYAPFGMKGFVELYDRVRLGVA